MTWLEDLETEKREAKAEKSNLKKLSRQAELEKDNLVDELRALNYLIKTSRARRRKLRTEIPNALNSISALADKLYHVERTIVLYVSHHTTTC